MPEAATISCMDCEPEILSAVSDEKRFIRLILSGPKAGAGAEWLKVVVRPVRTAARSGSEQVADRALQAILQGSRKQVTRSIAPADLRAELHRILGMGFLNVHLQ